ncbi:MAG: GTP-binding protein [Lysobacteraceae bacterium]|nr:MAG: GTP-binding protein [Xanthomonadaceae bacterium]
MKLPVSAALLPPLHDSGAVRLGVTVLTGFLGSGKTTLLNRLLRLPDLRGTAVIINEFGAVGLDQDLVAQTTHTEEDMVLLANGCICCTVRGDLVAAFETLAASDAAQSGALQHIIIETTGLADPAPILHTLMGDPRVARHARLAGVACTVDVCHAMRTLDWQPEAVKQVAVADRLLLTKTDLLADSELTDLLARLSAINPAASVTQTGDDNLAALLGLRTLDHEGDSASVRQIDALDLDAAVQAADDGDGSYQPLRARGTAPGQDVNRHDDRIRAHAIVRDVPLSKEGFFAWLDMIAAMRGDDLLRVKGIVNLAGESRPLVIHGVQHLFHPPEYLPQWPGNDRRTRIVFITRDIEREAIDDTLRVFERRRPRGDG